MLTTAFSTPASSRRSSTWSISGLPATSTSGFGLRSVSGRMRVPSPAASTMAVFGMCASPGMRSDRLEDRHVDAVPAVERRQRGMRQRALQIAPHARQVAQVLRLAVAAVEAGEDAEDFRGALRSERRIDAREGGRVELLVGVAARAGVTRQKRDLHHL